MKPRTIVFEILRPLPNNTYSSILILEHWDMLGSLASIVWYPYRVPILIPAIHIHLFLCRMKIWIHVRCQMGSLWGCPVSWTGCTNWHHQQFHCKLYADRFFLNIVLLKLLKKMYDYWVFLFCDFFSCRLLNYKSL